VAGACRPAGAHAAVAMPCAALARRSSGRVFPGSKDCLPTVSSACVPLPRHVVIVLENRNDASLFFFKKISLRVAELRGMNSPLSSPQNRVGLLRQIFAPTYGVVVIHISYTKYSVRTYVRREA
jgi:hypothetical protein